jgi:predicted permease
MSSPASILYDLAQDLRFALRSSRQNPAYTIAAISTLAIGIGANTAIFSIVSGVLLRPLPFARPDQLVALYETQPRTGATLGFDGPIVFQDFDEWRSRGRLLAGMAAYSTSARNLQAAGLLEQVTTISAERGLFGLLGVAPLLGRTFRQDDPLHVAVASYGFWKTYLAGDPSAVGRPITLDGEEFPLIGVMPEAFQFPYSSTTRQLWLPWEASADLRSHPSRRLDAAIARLKPAAGIETARQELNSMESASRGGRIVRLRPLKDVVSGTAQRGLLVLLGAVGMVLLVACLNVANLLLARTASRAREIAIRAAVGAGRCRLARQFLSEGLLLAFAGGLAGFAMGVPGTRLLLRLAASQTPRAREIGTDWRVFAFLLAVCTITGVGFGLAPAVAAARGLAGGLARRGIRSAVRDALVVAEIALAFMLLAGAGLLLRTFLNLRNADPGLNPENVLTAHVAVSGSRESMAIEQRVSRIPGVRAAGLISLLPLQDSGWGAGLTIPGRTETYEIELRFVTPGYFRAMGIPLVRGRELSAFDAPGAPGAILINQALARLCFPGEDPVGRRTGRGTVVGVVGDVRDAALHTQPKPEIYHPVAQNFAQLGRLGSTLVVRSGGPPEALAAAIRAAVGEVSPGQAVFHMATMRQVIDESLDSPRLYLWTIGLFAAIAMLLAVAGIYGVTAYVVTLRTREFGIRMALGADASRILRQVLARGAWWTLLGLTLGAGGAVLLTRVLQGVLYGVAATDPATFLTAAALLAAAALAACLAPAHRAATLDPSISLRFE